MQKPTKQRIPETWVLGVRLDECGDPVPGLRLVLSYAAPYEAYRVIYDDYDDLAKYLGIRSMTLRAYLSRGSFERRVPSPKAEPFVFTTATISRLSGDALKAQWALENPRRY